MNIKRGWLIASSSLKRFCYFSPVDVNPLYPGLKQWSRSSTKKLPIQSNRKQRIDSTCVLCGIKLYTDDSNLFAPNISFDDSLALQDVRRLINNPAAARPLLALAREISTIIHHHQGSHPRVLNWDCDPLLMGAYFLSNIIKVSFFFIKLVSSVSHWFSRLNSVFKFRSCFNTSWKNYKLIKRYFTIKNNTIFLKLQWFWLLLQRSCHQILIVHSHCQKKTQVRTNNPTSSITISTRLIFNALKKGCSHPQGRERERALV